RAARLTRPELAEAFSPRPRFRVDDNELMAPNELEPSSTPPAALTEDQTRRGKYAPVPAVVELSSDDPSFRPVRLLLKKYDKGTNDGAAEGDNRLSAGGFALDPKDFASADTDSHRPLANAEPRP